MQKKRAQAIHNELTEIALEVYARIKRNKNMLKRKEISKEEEKDIKMTITGAKFIQADVNRLVNATNDKYYNFDFKYASDKLDMRQKIFKSGLLRKLYASDKAFYDMGQE